MYKHLPYKIKRKVKQLLKQNQFLKAKALHDSYMEKQICRRLAK